MTDNIRKLTHDRERPDIMEGHLGGCAFGGDSGTYYPLMWKSLFEDLDIKSVIDVGCGRGFSGEYFLQLGCDVLGVEGAIEAVETSLIPENVVQHDYTKGPFVPENEYDLCWSCEFVEHVEEQYRDNFIETFKSAKYVAITYAYPGQGGHHHVNENTEEYWIEHIEAAGFTFNEQLTEKFRKEVKKDIDRYESIPDQPYYIPHFYYRGLIFERD
tara:strand:- start:638 stop:1279 length:642 start_codon:yes stop_codon:yes gene_type:complete